MKDLSVPQPPGEKYEPPQAVRLSDSAVGAGASCNPGSSPSGSCKTGNFANGDCSTGYSATPNCLAGTLGYSGCKNGPAR